MRRAFCGRWRHLGVELQMAVAFSSLLFPWLLFISASSLHFYVSSSWIYSSCGCNRGCNVVSFTHQKSPLKFLRVGPIFQTNCGNLGCPALTFFLSFYSSLTGSWTHLFFALLTSDTLLAHIQAFFFFFLSWFQKLLKKWNYQIRNLLGQHIQESVDVSYLGPDFKIVTFNACNSASSLVTNRWNFLYLIWCTSQFFS